MDHFKQAEEKLYNIPSLRSALEQYKRACNRIYRLCAPQGIAPVDYSKPHVQSSRPVDTLGDLDKLAHFGQRIAEIEESINEIMDVIEQLKPEQQKLIEMWYFERKTKEQIAEVLHYSSTATIYRRRKKALSDFVKIYPW